MISLHLPESGRTFSKLKSYDVEANVFTGPSRFGMSIFQQDAEELRRQLMPWTPVEIQLDSRLVMSGIILDQEVGSDDTIHIRGTDHTCRLDGGDLDPANQLAEDLPLPEAIGKLVAPFGFGTILEDCNALRDAQCGAAAVTPASPAGGKTVPKEKVRPERARSAVERLAAKYGYLIQPGPDGSSLSVCKPEYNQPALYALQRRPVPSRSNNIQSRSVSRGYKHVPTYVTASSRSGHHAESQVGNRVSAKIRDLIEANDELREFMGRRCLYERWDHRGGAVTPGLVKDGVQQFYAPRFIADNHTGNEAELEARVTREFLDFLKGTLTYRATIPGHTIDGVPVTPDTMMSVSDPVAGVQEDLYVSERSFHSSGSKQSTRMTLIRPGSFAL